MGAGANFQPDRSSRQEVSSGRGLDAAFGAELTQFKDLGSSISRNLSSAREQEKQSYQERTVVMEFDDYLGLATREQVTRSAFQRMYDMIVSYGVDIPQGDKDPVPHYKLFDDPFTNGRAAIYGLDEQLHNIVNFFENGAKGLGNEKRMLLLAGPVGSSKSSIAALLKRGLEEYTKTREGSLFTLGWVDPDDSSKVNWCPMNEEPLNAIPQGLRGSYLKALNEASGSDYEIKIKNNLCPCCAKYASDLMEEKGGDFGEIAQSIRVKRVVFDEKRRVGIATYQPKDEKNQDATELTGDVNYRKLAQYGSDSDPRAFSYDGEFQVANRGMFEAVEILKLEVAFLYEFLGATQEQKVKPKKNAQTEIDEVILGHTNMPEFNKLVSNEFMEALKDRTRKFDVPYVLKLSDEIKIYEKDYNRETVKGKLLAPHTIEMAAMWSVLTRLEEPKNASLTLMQKLKLYNGKTLPGFTEENIKELKDNAEDEGMSGVSPRYIQDTIGSTLISYKGRSINPFMLLKALDQGLKNYTLANEETKEKYKERLGMVKSEYEAILKNEVQRAIAADDEALSRLCGNYIDNVKCYTQKEKIKNQFTGQYEPPNEKLMRSIEEKIDIPESRKDDFRREIMNYVAALTLDGKTFDFRTNERLYKAIEMKLFEDQKDTVKLTSLVSNVIDADTQAKIDVVKARLIRDYGYDDESATDVLHYVASIFARGT